MFYTLLIKFISLFCRLDSDKKSFLAHAKSNRQNYYSIQLHMHTDPNQLEELSQCVNIWLGEDLNVNVTETNV